MIVWSVKRSRLRIPVFLVSLRRFQNWTAVRKMLKSTDSESKEEPVAEKEAGNSESSPAASVEKSADSDVEESKAPTDSGGEKSADSDVWELEASAADGGEKSKAHTADGVEKSKASAGVEESVNKHLQYKEVEADLFLCPVTSSLAHCVSKDLCMSKGIAAIFKENFGHVNELKKQAKNVGECAVLQFPHRYIYYLITKKAYYHKPTYADLEASLVQMKKHIQANGVKELSIPQLGCGLDRLVWKKVSAIIKEVFAHVDISITVYIFIKSSK